MTDATEAQAKRQIADEVIASVLRADRRLTVAQVKAAALEAGADLTEPEVRLALRRLRADGRARFHNVTARHYPSLHQPAGWIRP